MSGHLVAYSQENVVELREFNQLMTGEITRFEPGKILSPELLAYIPHGSFIWGDVENVPTPLTQKMMWQAACNLIRKGRKYLDEVNSATQKYRQYTFFQDFKINTTLLNRLSMFFGAMKISLPPSEGLERFLIYLKDSAHMDEEFAYLEKLHDFFTTQFQSLNKYHHYCQHPQLKIQDPLLQEKYDTLKTALSAFEKNLEGDYAALQQRWEDFHETFTHLYNEAHDAYYQADIFSTRTHIESLEEIKTLRRIATLVPSVTFSGEWWTILKLPFTGYINKAKKI